MQEFVIRIFNSEMQRPSPAKLWQIPEAAALPTAPEERDAWVWRSGLLDPSDAEKVAAWDDTARHLTALLQERGQRRITVNYARRQGGRNAYMNQTSFLPLKLNMAGVIPAIFASSILAFPATLAMWSGENSGATTWLQRISNALAPGEPLHMIVFAAMIIGFASIKIYGWFVRKGTPILWEVTSDRFVKNYLAVA